MQNPRAELLLIALARRLADSGEGQRIREDANLTGGEVARTVGIGVTTLWRWEKGERRPRGAPAARWAELLNELRQEVGAAS